MSLVQILAKNTAKKELKLWHLFLLVPIMMIVFFIGVVLLFQTLDLTSNGMVVEGEVTAVHVSTDEDGTQYTPTFRFMDEGGQSHTKESSMSSSTPYREAQIIEVIYLTEDPAESAKINTFFELWFLPLLLIGISTVMEFSLIIGFMIQQKSRIPGQTTTHQNTAANKTLNPLLLSGAKVTSRYWQTVREGDQKYLEVQYTYENQSYKTRSRTVTDKQLEKLVPGEEVTLRVDKKNPSQAWVMI